MRLRTSALVLSAYLGGLGTAGLATARTRSETPLDLPAQLGLVLAMVEQSYVEPVARQKILEGAIMGMVGALDPHSSYLPPEEYSRFQADTQGRFGGVGVEVDFRGEQVRVIAPIPGSPAARAGIRSEDRILAIDGVPTAGRSADDLVRRMRGRPGTQVVLTLTRPGRESAFDVTLTREVVVVRSVEAALLAERVGYLRIKQFQEGTHAELLEAVAQLRREAGGTPAGWLLDLRNDPGGLVDEAVAVADELLPAGVIVSTRHRGREVDRAEARRGGALVDGPLAVLVNEYSASAAEIVAGAVQDHRRGTLVGARTFGKGSVQSILDLPGGAGLKLTTALYFTPGGRSIQAHGIIPDLQVGAVATGGALGVQREADLEGHLPGPGAAAPRQVPPGNPAGQPASAGAVDPDLGVPREVPRDPSRGNDAALRAAWELVLGRRSPR